jgi:hypothetical protein
MARDKAMATMAMQLLVQLYQRASRTHMDITKEMGAKQRRARRPTLLKDLENQ